LVNTLEWRDGLAGFILGFFLMGQIPLAFSLLQLKPSGSSVRIQAFTFKLPATNVAPGVLCLSIKSFCHCQKVGFVSTGGVTGFVGAGWLCVALPLVVVVSLINQQLARAGVVIRCLWLEGQDQVALAIFFFTAALIEILVPGLFLPSLTRYLPYGVNCGVIFAVAHLSLSEILPLTVLGMVLGWCTRDRAISLLRCCYSLWNSGTLLSLFILGSGSG